MGLPEEDFLTKLIHPCKLPTYGTLVSHLALAFQPSRPTIKKDFLIFSRNAGFSRNAAAKTSLVVADCIDRSKRGRDGNHSAGRGSSQTIMSNATEQDGEEERFVTCCLPPTASSMALQQQLVHSQLYVWEHDMDRNTDIYGRLADRPAGETSPQHVGVCRRTCLLAAGWAQPGPARPRYLLNSLSQLDPHLNPGRTRVRYQLATCILRAAEGAVWLPVEDDRVEGDERGAGLACTVCQVSQVARHHSACGVSLGSLLKPACRLPF